MAEKFVPAEKAMIANAIDNMIKVEMRAAKAATHDAVRTAHETCVKEYQDLFIKVRQNL